MSRFAQALLDWYDRCGRSFVFRGTKDPYRVWLSEIMLQQTRTESVPAYYERFLAAFPDVRALAAAEEQEVLRCWQGLGYYSRARNLLKCARTVVNDHGGVFPGTSAALRQLPGIGPYTAAAIAAIAFNERAPAMDGNLIRVFARYTDEAEDAAQPATLRKLTEAALSVMPGDRPGDFNQALMDLGATVCTPGTPDCARCPIRDDCRAARAGTADLRPVLRRKRPPTPVNMAVVLVLHQGRIYLRPRTEALLRGMYVFALSEHGPDQALRDIGLPPLPVRYLGEARHVFTHRVWNMTICAAYPEEVPAALTSCLYTADEMSALPMPVAMRAARELALKELKHDHQ